ncbi:MAG: sugar phosphate isomerase/epimerase [Firmicutes bacterium]|nr:sugar phosphate isomerase/epimerase [Bacillota bacterium]
MKFAICNEIFLGWDFARMVTFVARTGYEGLEIAPFTLGDAPTEIGPLRRRELRMMVEEAGLKVTGLHWLLVRPAGLHIAHPDEGIRRRTIAHLCSLVDLCADLGGQIVVLGSPEQRRIPEGMHPEEGWRRAAETIAACAEAAAARGVFICLEALPRTQTNLLNTNAEVMKMVEEIAHPNVDMMLDVKSMCAEDISVVENIRSCRGRFRHVHANDANLRGPGFGAVDFRPIFAALVESGYDGYVSVEVFDVTPDPVTVAEESLRCMKRCLPSPVG